MAVFRVEKTKDFTIMCNHHLRNRKLSLKAKGLLSLMLSLPEDWDYTTKGLAHICKDGIDAISTALKELEQQGYLTRERVRLPNGRLGDIEYTIHEQPVTLDIPPNSPKRKNPRQVNPGQDFPEQVKPEQENHAQLNTNRPKTEKENTDISSTHQSIYPKAGERKYNSETQDRMDWMDEANAYRDLIKDMGALALLPVQRHAVEHGVRDHQQAGGLELGTETVNVEHHDTLVEVHIGLLAEDVQRTGGIELKGQRDLLRFGLRLLQQHIA